LPKPGNEEITRILKNTLGAIKVAKEVKWNELSKDLLNYSAALIVKIAFDAAKIAVLSGKQEVDMTHFLQSMQENKNYKT